MGIMNMVGKELCAVFLWVESPLRVDARIYLFIYFYHNTRNYSLVHDHNESIVSTKIYIYKSFKLLKKVNKYSMWFYLKFLILN